MNERPFASSFDVDAWQEELLALNDWARELTIVWDDDEFLVARQSATLARHAKGRNEWNAWASAMLALQERLRASSRWTRSDRDYTEQADLWINVATVSFSAENRVEEFTRHAEFQGFLFPWTAFFSSARFIEDVDFLEAEFHGFTYFDHISFGSTASFVFVKFHKFVAFNESTFSGFAPFNGASFSDVAAFDTVTFEQPVDFAQCQFLERAIFHRTKFRGPADFSRCYFPKGADFDAIESSDAFSLAGAAFQQVPSVMGATFRGTLRLHNVMTPSYPLLGWTPEGDAPARFRELKRHANETQDRDRELEFFAQEIRTSRFHAKGLPTYIPRIWEWRFWFGLFFGTFSDFGRSVWRPVFFWALLLFGFGVFYLGEHEEIAKARADLASAGSVMGYLQTTRTALSAPPACIAQGRLFGLTDAVTEAFHLSLRNALIFDAGRADAFRRTYGCLFGLEGASAFAPPVVPPRISIASTLQSATSGILIFLLLLAVRNLLRLK